MPKKSKIIVDKKPEVSEEQKQKDIEKAEAEKKQKEVELREQIKFMLSQEKKKLRNEKYYNKRKEEKVCCDVCLTHIDGFYFSKHCETKKHLDTKKLREEKQI